MSILYFALCIFFSCMNTYFIRPSTIQSKIFYGMKSLQGPKSPLSQILSYKSKKQMPNETHGEIESSEETFIDLNDTSARFATTGLLIFLDDSEKGAGAITNALLAALSQQAAPILASTSLFASIESIPTIKQLIENSRQKPELKQQLIDLQDGLNTLKTNLQEYMEKKYKNEELEGFLKAQPWYLKFLNTKNGLKKKEIGVEIGDTLIKELSLWNLQEWIIKAADSSENLLLLIPKNYKDTLYKVDFSHYDQPTLASSAPLSDLEYKTGLKINHMQTLRDYTDALPLQKTGFLNYFKRGFSTPAGTRFIHSLQEAHIFVTRSEYAQSNMQYKQQRWAFHLLGHGMIKRSVSKLSLPEFSLLLNFLDTKINTSLLAYTSCYSTGTNQQLIYGDLLNPNTFSFTIATAGISDSPSALASLFKFKLEHDRIMIDSDVNLIEFIQHVTSDSINRIADFVTPLFPLGSPSLASSGYRQLTPQIRLPGTEWFSVAGHEGTIASLGTVFSKTCSQVDLIKRFSKQGKRPEFYLMYSPVIPCELILNSDRFEKTVFVPMAPTKTSLSNTILSYIKELYPIELISGITGTQLEVNENTYMYYIKKLTVPERFLNDVMNMFLGPISKWNNLLLWIDELEIKKVQPYDPDNSVSQTEQTELLFDVFIQKYAKNPIEFYTKKDISGSEKFYRVTTDDMGIGFIPNQPEETSDYRYLKKNLGFEKMIEEFDTTRAPIQNIQKVLEKKKEETLLKGSSSENE